MIETLDAGEEINAVVVAVVAIDPVVMVTADHAVNVAVEVAIGLLCRMMSSIPFMTDSKVERVKRDQV